jgi:hypothetical protein
MSDDTPPKKICASCKLKEMGCKVCADDDNMSCKMCKKGYALQSGADGKMMCVEKCVSGYYKKMVEVPAVQVDITFQKRMHAV